MGSKTFNGSGADEELLAIFPSSASCDAGLAKTLLLKFCYGRLDERSQGQEPLRLSSWIVLDGESDTSFGHKILGGLW